MSGVIPRFEHGWAITFQVVETIKGGQLVEARAGSKVGVAAAGSLKCLGVATKDARVPITGTTTDAEGFPVQSLVEVTEYVAVNGGGAVFPVTYAAAAAFGDRLICAALGQVTPAGVAPDARTIVGICYEPAGVLIGAVGLAKIRC